jgi:hypothetical protein
MLIHILTPADETRPRHQRRIKPFSPRMKGSDSWPAYS